MVLIERSALLKKLSMNPYFLDENRDVYIPLSDVRRIINQMPGIEADSYAQESQSSTGAVFAHIATALARDYTDLYYVDMQTGAYIEYHIDDESGALTEARRGTDFFESCKREAKLCVHPEDQAAFIKAMNRQFLTEALDRTRVFEMTYRRVKRGTSYYVRMKVTRMKGDSRYIVIGVTDTDE